MSAAVAVTVVAWLARANPGSGPRSLSVPPQRGRLFEGDEAVDYAFMGQDPNAADNQWLREAFEQRIPIIYFLGIAPGRYQAMLRAFVSGWDKNALKVRVAFGLPEQEGMTPPESAGRAALSQTTAAPGVLSRGCHYGVQRPMVPRPAPPVDRHRRARGLRAVYDVPARENPNKNSLLWRM